MTRSKGIVLLLTARGALGLVATTLGRAIFQGQTPGLGSFAAIHFVGFLFLSPLSSPNTLLAAGIRRYHPVKAFLYSTAGPDREVRGDSVPVRCDVRVLRRRALIRMTQRRHRIR